MKRLFFIIQGLFVYPFLAVPAFAESINPCDADAGGNDITRAICNLTGEGNFGKIFGNIITAFTVIAVIIALIYLVYGGIKYITSRGEKTEVEAARNQIVAAIAGIILVFLALFIISIVLGIFGLNLVDLQIPKILP